MKVTWTEQALMRLAEMEEYIAADDPAAALAQTERIIGRAEKLSEFPHVGRRLPEIPLGRFRELVLGNYRLVYRVRSESVEVLTVFESHRLLPEGDLPIGEWSDRQALAGDPP